MITDRLTAMKTEKIPKSIGTHDGTFHADEVTACALLIDFGLVEQEKIFRTREPKLLEQCEFVCDVGGIYDPGQKLFDHHQADYDGPLSSAGMVLLYLKNEGILTEREHEFYHQTLVAGVDAHDNGRDPQLPGVNTYSHIISNFTPISYEATPEEQDAAFYRALEFAKGHLKRLLERYRYTRSTRRVVEEEMEKGRRHLFFERAMPWMDVFFEMGGVEHPALYVVMPSGKHWKLRGIPPNAKERMKVRRPLPQKWAGLLDEELRRASGIEGAIFCHKGRFISVWETKEDALRALELVMEGL